MKQKLIAGALVTALSMTVVQGAVTVTDYPDPFDIHSVSNIATVNGPVAEPSVGVGDYSRFGLDAGENDWQTFTVPTAIQVQSLYYGYNDYRAGGEITLSIDAGNDGSDDYAFTGIILTNLTAGGDNDGPVNYLQFDLSGESVTLAAGMHKFTVACTSEETNSISFIIAPIRNSTNTYAGGTSKYSDGDPAVPNDAIFAITSVDAIPLFFGSTVPADGAIGVEALPVISCEVVDGSDTLNTNSIAMTLDGSNVVSSLSKVGPTSTVSYAVTTELEPGSTHTAQLVVSGAGSGPFTNTWSFTVVADAANRTYVDATDVNTLISFSNNVFEAWYPADTTNNWRARDLGNETTVYESNEDSGRLQTTVSGLSNATYNVYAYMWVAEGSDWRMAAALTNNPAGDLPLYHTSDYPSNTAMSVHYVEYGPGIWGNAGNPSPNPYYSTNDVANQFGTDAVMIAYGNRRLAEIYLGQVTGTEITVYVDDEAFETISDYDPRRTWYDGIGYEVADSRIPPIPEIQTFSVSGGNASLTWVSDTFATYSILRKTNLTDSSWTSVRTGISGSDGTTSDSVPVSGANQEFYRIEGN